MHRKIIFSYLLTFLLFFVAACSSASETAVNETPESVAAATDLWTNTPTPTIEPSPTATFTPLPTSTATPSPTPTETPFAAQFSNLTLALDYDQKSLEPISPRDYFPLGVTYIAAVFDYLLPDTTNVYWSIYGENGDVADTGVVNLNARADREGFIIRPEEGLDQGQYELVFELGDEVVLSTQFDVFWEPTIWPLMIHTDPNANYKATNTYEQFVFGTEHVYSTFPAINFQIDDVIFVEWFVDGEKLGERQLVWDNAEWSTGIHGSKIDNQLVPEDPLPVGKYEAVIYVNDVPKQCKAFEIVKSITDLSEDADVAGEGPGCENFVAEVAEPGVSDSDGTWDRYQVRTFRELDELTDEVISETTNQDIVYLEMSPDYQYPSRVNVTFTGELRDTSEAKLEWIKVWLATFAPNLTPEEVEEIFAQEGLFLEDSVEYWLPIQSSLIPIMEDELTSGDKIDLLLLWMGATTNSEQVDRIYLVNAFE